MTPVELPIPPSANMLWRVARYAARSKARVTLNERYKLWLDEAIIRLRMGMDRVRSYPVAIRVMVCRGAGWKSGRDLDNCLKPIIDALVKAQRLESDDDSHVIDCRIRFGPTLETACVMVAVELPEAMAA